MYLLTAFIIGSLLVSGEIEFTMPRFLIALIKKSLKVSVMQSSLVRHMMQNF